MGGRHSKHDAVLTNDLSRNDSDFGDDRDEGRCLACLFPPKKVGSHASSHDGSGGSHSGSSGSAGWGSKGAGSKGSKHPALDPLGTPIPDTPEPVRRLRDAAMERYYDEMGEEKKSGSGEGGSFGRVGRGPAPDLRAAKFSSRYGGLEKETSQMFDGEAERGRRPPRAGGQNGVVGGGRWGGREEFAEIHDGPDAESKLYKKYELCEVLGVGSTSTCHRCIELATGLSRACKIVDKNEIDIKYRESMSQFYTEIKTLRSLQHPHIIQLFDVYLAPDKIYIVMELMSGGELFDYVVQKGTLTEEEASRIVRKVTAALVYMHSRNVIHRDMKPENLLLAHKPRSSHDVEVKIIDFGLSKILTEGPATGSFLGTRGYLAPEMIQRRNYTKSVDAWALGVVIFVLLCGCLPFDDDCQTIPNSPDLRSKFTLRFPRWAKDLSPSARDLLGKLLDVNPCRRLTAEQAMDHPWIRGDTASRDSLLQSPGRIQPSPGRRGGKGAAASSQATKDHVSQMVANRAIANAQVARMNSPRVHVRKTSI